MKTHRLATAALLALSAGIAVPSAAVARPHHRAPRLHHVRRPATRASRVSFYARVVRSSAQGLIVRTSKGRVLSFSTKQIKRSSLPRRHRAHVGLSPRFRSAFEPQLSADSVVVNILGLQPGVLVQITETTDASGAVTITITLPPPSGAQSASGVVNEVDDDAFTVQTPDGSVLRLHLAGDTLSNLNLQPCDTVAVRYHQDAGILIADSVVTTGSSTSGDCAPSYDMTGTITQVSAGILVVDGEQGSTSFSVDPSSGVTDGYQAGDLVDVTYIQNSDGTMTATDVEFVEEDTSGQVTSVTSSRQGGSITITDDNTGQSEVFTADPSNGVQINAHAFNGVAVGDHVELTYHQSGGQLVADTVSEQ